MQPFALDDARQLRLGDDFLRLRPAKAHRILEHAFQQHRDEQQHDEVEQQRGHHLVDAEAGLEDRRAKQQQSAGKHRRQHDDGDEDHRGQRQRAGAEYDCNDATDIKLRLSADVPQLGAEGDRDGKTGEDQRSGAGQRLKQGELRAGGTLGDEVKDRQRRSAGGKHQQRGDEQRGNDRRDRE